MNNPNQRQDSIDRLAEEFVDRYRRGEHPAVSEYTANHPEFAEEIRDLFPALVMLEQIAPDSESELSENAAPAKCHVAGQVGDFRLIREVGRGGMGVVYEAEQVSLGRRVALKILPAQLLANDKQRRRFEREARAAARLHHTNIVPVFGVGEHEGLHYYAMQFIHGLGLDEVLGELQRMRELTSTGNRNGTRRQTVAGTTASHVVPAGRRAVLATGVAQSLMSGQFDRTLIVKESGTEAGTPDSSDGSTSVSSGVFTRDALRDTAEGRLSETIPGHKEFVLPGQSKGDSHSSASAVYWQSVARIGAQTAEALKYAHDQGIIHRDIKPANLLLDSSGTVWVTDFGLAKAADQQDLTQTGDVLGTLRYMAPEQLEGKTDHRSDIYSLGLTLYELLALKPAFDEKDRSQLIKQVAAGTPVKLRLVDPKIPRDLETVVHKALEREPGHRYQTAGELADDLKRYLGDEPIQARRISSVARFSRWCRRNPVVASLSSAVALLLLVTSVVSVVAYQQTSAALVQAKESAEDARQNAVLAEKKTTEAEASAARAAENALRAERNALAAAQSTALAQENEKKALTEAEKSKQVSDFLVKLFEGPQPVAWMGMQLDAIGVGSKMTARELLDRGAKQVQIDLKGQPELLAKMLDTLGHIYNSLGYIKEAEPLLLDALKRRKELLGPDHLDVAVTLEHLGILRNAQGDFSQALQLHQDALAIRQKKLGEEHQQVADSLFYIGLTYLLQTRYQESGDSARRSLVLRQKLLPASHPDTGFPMLCLANARYRGATGNEDPLALVAQAAKVFGAIAEGENFGALLARWMQIESGQIADVEKEYQILIDRARRVLGDEHPWVVKFYSDRVMFFAGNKPDRAEKAARDALALTRKVYGDEHPATGTTMMRLAITIHHNRKNVSAAQYKEAEELYRKSLIGLDKELKLAKGQGAISPRRREGMTQHGLAEVLTAQGRHAEAITWYEKAIQGWDKYHADFPNAGTGPDFKATYERTRKALEEARKKAETKKN